MIASLVENSTLFILCVMVWMASFMQVLFSMIIFKMDWHFFMDSLLSVCMCVEWCEDSGLKKWLWTNALLSLVFWFFCSGSFLISLLKDSLWMPSFPFSHEIDWSQVGLRLCMHERRIFWESLKLWKSVLKQFEWDYCLAVLLLKPTDASITWIFFFSSNL